MEGLDLDDDSKEGKLFAAIVDTLDEIASEISDMEEDLMDLNDYAEEIDMDLGDVEDFVYGDDDCDCCCDDDCDCDCDCECGCRGHYTKNTCRDMAMAVGKTIALSAIATATTMLVTAVLRRVIR